MKKCEYCAKELESYHLQYCKDSDCEERALKFYTTRNKYEKLFGGINLVAFLAIMVGLIAALFTPTVGNIIVSAALIVMGVLVMVLPFAPDSFYQKYRIKKTTIIVRIFAGILFVAAAVFAILAFYYSLKQL